MNVRGNRLANGVTATFQRQRRIGKPHDKTTVDALRLAVHGTCDILASTMQTIGKARCPCCNGTGRYGYQLTAKGKMRLAALKRKQQ